MTTPTYRRLDAEATEHLHRLTTTWRLIADLSFSDLLLVAPLEGEPERFRVIAQQRPYTARTLYPEDMVGRVVDAQWHPWVERAWREARRRPHSEPAFIDAEPVRVEAVPVRQRGDVVAVLSIEAADLPDRAIGRFESAYLECADALLHMLELGKFPFSAANDLISSPRVGDGLMVVDALGMIQFSSPNANSAFRRIGTSALTPGRPAPEPVRVLAAEATATRRPVEYEIDEESGVVIDLRVVPLLWDGGWSRSLVLSREVTDLRRKDRLISLREATIREVHHRVKNNLQTVASLLRLQARRMSDQPQAAAALEESVRRIAAIALVHETLTEELEGAADMRDVARRVVRMLEGSLAREDVRIQLVADSVRVNAAVATPVAVVLNELVQNAVQHGLGEGPGTVNVTLRGGNGRPLVLEVTDDGGGVPPPPAERERDGLGLPLVKALIADQLGGEFSLTARDGHGSVARAVVPVR
ncbi:MAG TPA: sensor histidine kinase [Actinomycetes bacterium]|nr:sensor histidine kinase [Actinomycetes bacterium]